MLSRVRSLAAGAVLGAGALLAATAAPAVAAQQPAPGQQVRSLEQPQLQAVGAAVAWQVSRGSGVTVAVLDTGVDGTVPDLAGSVTAGPDLISGVDPSGYQPPRQHGTYIASLIAGHGSGPGGADGVIGVAPQARVLSVRVIPDDSEPGLAIFNANPSYQEQVAQGIRYAVSHGARVINMSLGGEQPLADVRAAIAAAIASKVVVVASAGNNGTSGSSYTPYDYPASYTGVISVAAVNASGGRASFSDDNASVVISAPGVNVIGAGPHGQYLIADGTSPAAAFVSGVAALIVSRFPSLSPALVEQALVTSATHRPGAGYSTGVGFGEVSAPAALAAATRLARIAPDHGLAATARFVRAPALQVAHRDGTKIAAASAVAGLGFLAALALLVAAGAQFRRRPSITSNGG